MAESNHAHSGIAEMVLFKPYCLTCNWTGLPQVSNDDARQLLDWHRGEDHPANTILPSSDGSFG